MTDRPMQAELFEELSQTPGVLVRAEEPLSRHVPLRVGGPVELWVTVEDPAALPAVLSAARRSKQSWRLCWPMTDLLVRDGGLRGLMIRLGRGFEGVRHEDGLCWIGSAALWSGLAGRPLSEALTALSRWPGSVGGLLHSEDRARLTGLVAALRWQVGRRVETVEVAPGEAPPELPKTAVLLELALRPELTVPKGRRKPRIVAPLPAGSLFAAPDGEAADVLRRAGLGGSRLRSWRLTREGLIVQLGGGSCKDVLLFAQGLQERVERERGVTLTTRLPIVGVEPRA